MRRWNWQTPWWVTALVSGVLFGAFEVVWQLTSEGRDLLSALIGGIVSGSLFGPFMGWITSRNMRRLGRSVGDVPSEDQRAISRAATRGPVPTDPAIRAAALRLATFRAQELHRLRVFNFAVFTAFMALSLFLAFTQSLGWLAAFVLFALVAVSAVLQRRRLRRRIAALIEVNPPAGSSTTRSAR